MLGYERFREQEERSTFANVLDIVRAVRVAHGVRKQLVASDGERYLTLEWVKP